MTRGSAAGDEPVTVGFSTSGVETPEAPVPDPSGAAVGSHGFRSLVVVSNRLPFTATRRADGVRFNRSAGGLVAALDPVLAQHGGVWIGWSGLEHRHGDSVAAPPGGAEPGVRYRGVALSAREVAGYYRGFANRTIWPLFHYFVGRTRISPDTWPVYERVNARFAEAAADASDNEDLVWIHDYQLLRAPLHLRKRAPGRRIAFFLHIPFPAFDVFRVLPWAKPVLQGMLGADLVGFHVPSYAEHFLQSAERLLACEVDRRRGLVKIDGREVSVGAYPIGVDAAQLERLAEAVPEVPPREPQIFEVLGVDRLDYTKGIYERLMAIERLLERRPTYRGRVVFTQLLVPSREHIAEYGTLKRDIDETVGRINGRFSERGWTPIRYLVRSLPPAKLVVMYRAADVALVTPLRDGMNLVSKEYVASRTDGGGMLVLSDFAGAAEELHEALRVNPFDVDAVAEVLHSALSMSEEERQARMSALRERVQTNDVHAWVQRFLSATEQASARAGGASASAMDQVRRRLGPLLAQRSGTALFLDYDGTLTTLAPRPEEALLPDDARQIIRQAARAPGLDLAVVSTRTLADVRQQVGVEGITYIGNSGFEIDGPGLSFRHEETDQHVESLDAAAAELEAFGLPGAWIERRGVTVAYHLHDVPDRERRSLERRAAAVFRRLQLRVVVRRRVVEGRPRVEWDKARGMLRVLTHRYGVDWPTRVRALYVGDDETDVDAFRALKGIGRSVHVARHPARRGHAADFQLPDPNAVVQLLRWIAARPFAAVRT